MSGREQYLRDVGDVLSDDVLLAVGDVAGYDRVVSRAVDEVRAAREAASGRSDLRSLATYTIDPVDAHEYDDALSVRREQDESGLTGYTVWVHIPDVSAQLRQDGPIDRMARERGKARYGPDWVEGLFPDAVTAEMSLVEGRDRLAQTVEIGFDADGTYEEHDIYRSVIRTDRNASFDAANRALRQEKRSGARDGAEYRFIQSLEDLTFLKSRLAAHRGAARRRADAAQRIVQEFMVFTNHVCAEELLDRPEGVYRVHGAPQPGWDDRLADYLAASGAGDIADELENADDPRAVVEEFEAAEGAVLDESSRARYATYCRGHEALGLEAYAPFTAPLRRYADGVNWRLLRDTYDGGLEDIAGVADRLNTVNNREGAVVPMDEALEYDYDPS